jgi:uncharacterized damage-inducible protein DinB
MPWSDHYSRYARYNRWINQQLLDACEQLSAEQLQEDCGLFFGSVLGSWNHLLVTDLLWAKRMSVIFPILSELKSLPSPTTLRDTLVPDLPALRTMRTQIDDVLLRWCDLLRADDATDVVTYTNTRGEEMSWPLDLIMQHLFNHQTHHRGQITAALSRFGIDYGETDLLFAPIKD